MKAGIAAGIGDYVLGLDLGTGSVGWAVVDLDQSGEPCKIRCLGVRRFEAGVTGNIEAGQDKPPASARRTARQQRRQLWRRAWRLTKTYRTLQDAKLLPESGLLPDDRHAALLALDLSLFKSDNHGPHADRVAGHLLPYRLRAKAVEERLEPFAVGRALYHLAQRRGFQSNLKARKDEEVEGIVKKAIGQLEAQMAGRTLGQFFATLDPEEVRIRGRYTSRRMYEDEFEKIWAKQSEHHPGLLTEELKERLRSAIFRQRPLKSQKGLIGRCELEPAHRRAPVACMVAQRFRLLQKVNDLEITTADGEIRRLTKDERRQLATALDETGDRTFAQIRTLLGLKKSRGEFRGDTFNFEEGGEKKLVGNRTAAKIAETIGDVWMKLVVADRCRLVDEIIAFESEGALAARLQRAWSFDAHTAQSVAGVSLEQGYAGHSRKALAKILPRMEEGVRYVTARDEAYNRAQVALRHEQLPAVLPTGPRRHGADDALAAFAQLRNPAVARALSELRKVVNALIRRCGKPKLVRVELARDLKQSRKRRREYADLNQKNRDVRAKAAERIAAEMGEGYKTDRNVLKLRLADECHWICPYTGVSIEMATLLGEHPQFDIEHILPFSRTLDHSFNNKTLCAVEENHSKHNQTPFEAYSGTEHWPEILQRVRRFHGSAAREKLRRFLLEEVDDDFAQRSLTETRYISRLAGDYLGMLYGGQVDADGRRVQVSTGQVTAYLRERFDLCSILGSEGEKDRSDHRHHAIDALVVALTDPGTVHALNVAAKEADELGGRRLFVKAQPPWPELLAQARSAVESIVVSSRVKRRLNGQLHDANALSKPYEVRDAAGKIKTCHHFRKPLASMSAREVENIVDDRVREKVLEKLAQLGETNPVKAFKDPRSHPSFTARDGRVVFIHRARIRKADRTIEVGKGSARRYVAPGANHHMEIVAVLDEAGREKRWEGKVVGRFDAVARKCNGEPVVRRDHGPGRKFLFSLTGGEYVRMSRKGLKEELFRVTDISDGEVALIAHTDARPSSERRRKGSGARIRPSPDTMRTYRARKVVVDPLGEVLPASD